MSTFLCGLGGFLVLVTTPLYIAAGMPLGYCIAAPLVGSICLVTAAVFHRGHPHER